MFFLPDRVELIRLDPTTTPTTKSATGEDVLAEVAPVASSGMAAKIETYSETSDGGVVGQERGGIYYSIRLGHNTLTTAIKQRDSLKILASRDYPHLVGKTLGVVKPAGSYGQWGPTKHVVVVVSDGRTF